MSILKHLELSRLRVYLYVILCYLFAIVHFPVGYFVCMERAADVTLQMYL